MLGPRARVGAAAGALLVVALTVVVARRGADPLPCAAGFTRSGARCCPGPALAGGGCGAAQACPPPLVATPRGCDAPERDVVEVPGTTLTIGPSDWEAEGRVPPRTIQVARFRIDRFEVTAGHGCARGASFCDAADPARAASGVTLEAARAYCSGAGGRLPTEDEWLAAAGGRRYPWGDTGAVCRRAAWGLASGPCLGGGTGPDTAGAHPDGATALGIHDLAGNVAEWVEAPCGEGAPAGCGVVRGGSWRSTLATELRTWLRREVAAPESPDPTIGFRCAYAGSEAR